PAQTWIWRWREVQRTTVWFDAAQESAFAAALLVPTTLASRLLCRQFQAPCRRSRLSALLLLAWRKAAKPISPGTSSAWSSANLCSHGHSARRSVVRTAPVL